MPTIMACARLSDAVYADDPRADGWTRVAFQPAGSGLTNAFQGAAFQQGQELVFAFKGTSGRMDVVADLKLGVGMNTFQYASAMDFVARVGTQGYRAYVCGHSLGGAIAQIVGNRRRLPFVTFNAPGVGLVSRNVDEVGATLALGTAAVRTIGAIASAALHPIQAAQDAAALLYRVRGVNFRLGRDVVGSIGVHYGRVVQIEYAGGALDVLQKHKMTAMISALESSRYRSQELEAVLG